MKWKGSHDPELGPCDICFRSGTGQELGGLAAVLHGQVELVMATLTSLPCLHLLARNCPPHDELRQMLRSSSQWCRIR